MEAVVGFGPRLDRVRDEDYMAERARELAATQADLPADAPLEARARALGIGLAVEALVSPDAVRRDLYGDFVELLVEMSRQGGSAEPPWRRRATRS